MTEEEILKQRDPEGKYYKSFTEFFDSTGMIEFEDDYSNKMGESNSEIFYWILQDSDYSHIYIFSSTFDSNTNNIYLCLGVNGWGLIYNPETNESNINISYRTIRINILNPSYQDHSEDILTKYQKDKFIEFVTNNWDDIRKYSIENILMNTGTSLDNIFPKECPDFSNLETKD